MRILLSAYACEPNKGSEPGVGWNWARTLVQLGHQVHLITRSNNRPAIEAAIAAEALALSVSYYDLPDWARWWKRGQRGIHLYTLLWQLGIYGVAKTLLRTGNFDVIHHITFGIFREPSFLVFCDRPFIFGPVGGGEKAPAKLLSSLPLHLRIGERLRIFANSIVPLNPILRAMYSRTALTLCKTQETANAIPAIAHKVSIQLEIGCGDLPPSGMNRQLSTNKVRLLYVGRLLSWKGVHLAIQCFAQVRPRLCNATFTIVGSGRDEVWLRGIASIHNVLDSIHWVPWLPKEELHSIYDNHELLIFPSLHDSSGNVVLEALSHGLPVVCLDVGGPASVAGVDCGAIIPTQGATERDVVRRMADAVEDICLNADKWRKCSERATRRAEELSWKNVVGGTYAHIAQVIGVH